MSDKVDRLTATVVGRVQGVSFRYYTSREAVTIGLKGWVRNEIDGSVLVVAEGEKRELEKLVSFLRHGPPAATVQHVEVHWTKELSEYGDFEIRTL